MDSGQGVTGLVSLYGASPFTVRVLKFKDIQGSTDIPNTSQGQTFSSSRGTDDSGGLVLSGEVPRIGFPKPHNLKQTTGTIVLTFDRNGSITETKTVRVQQAVIDYDYKTDSMWGITLICTDISAPALMGWGGTQANATGNAMTLAYMHAGRSKSYDRNFLITESVRTIDIGWMTTDSDTGDNTVITAAIAAYLTGPQGVEKYRVGTLTRTDSHGGRFEIHYAMKDSRDDILNPETKKQIDPNDLTSHFTSGYIGSAASIPAVTSAAGFRLESRTTVKLTSGQSNVIDAFAKTDSKDRVLLPRQFISVDPLAVRSQASNAALDSTPTIQAGYKLRETKTENLTVAGTPHSVTVVQGGLRNTWDDITFPITERTMDPTNIAGHATSAIVTSAAFPAPQSLLTSSMWTYRKITDTLTVKVLHLDEQNPLQRIQNAGTVSVRSPVTPQTDVLTTVGNSTYSAYAYGTLTAAAWAATPFAFTQRNQKINPNVMKTTQTFINPGLRVISTLLSTPRYVPARLYSGAVQVWVTQVRKRAANRYLIKLGRNLIHTPIQLYTLRRSITGQLGTPTGYPKFPALVNTVNNAGFLDIPTGLAWYRGCIASVDWATASNSSNTYTWYIDYNFTEDFNGVFDFQGFQEGWAESSYAATPGSWVNISSLTGMGLVATIPSSADFSVFTA